MRYNHKMSQRGDLRLIWWDPSVIFPSSLVKNLPAMQETQVPSLGWEDPLEKGMATHSSILAWRSPWAEKPGGLQFMGSQRVRHNWATNTYIHTYQCHQGPKLLTFSSATLNTWLPFSSLPHGPRGCQVTIHHDCIPHRRREERVRGGGGVWSLFF